MLDRIARAVRAELEPATLPDEHESERKSRFFDDSPQGYFVEVGAYDPVLLSQSWQFEQLGWRGVLVEANPEKADILRRQRAAIVCNVAASSRANAGKSLPFYIAGMYSSLLSQSVTTGVAATHQITVQARTLDDILTQANAPSPIDFMSIDVEGHDLDVLDGLDLDRWRPRLLVVEDLAMTLDLHRYLSARGYRWIGRVGINAWYVPAAEMRALSLRGRWQFVRKYYLGRPFRHFREWKRRLSGRSLPPGQFDAGVTPRSGFVGKRSHEA